MMRGPAAAGAYERPGAAATTCQSSWQAARSTLSEACRAVVGDAVQQSLEGNGGFPHQHVGQGPLRGCVAVEFGNDESAVPLTQERAISWQQGKSSVWCRSVGLDSSRQTMAARSSSIARVSKARHSRHCARASEFLLRSRRARRGRAPCMCILQRPRNRADGIAVGCTTVVRRTAMGIEHEGAGILSPRAKTQAPRQHC